MLLRPLRLSCSFLRHQFSFHIHHLGCGLPEATGRTSRVSDKLLFAWWVSDHVFIFSFVALLIFLFVLSARRLFHLLRVCSFVVSVIFQFMMILIILLVAQNSLSLSLWVAFAHEFLTVVREGCPCAFVLYCCLSWFVESDDLSKELNVCRCI